VKILEKHLENPARFAAIKRWCSACLAALAITEVIAPRLIYQDHPHFWFEDMPAWGSFYGLISCVAIIVVSKLLGKLWLMRRENYYDS
jgi:hypothetical protein